MSLADDIRTAGKNLADAVFDEQKLEIDRPVVKLAAIERIMASSANTLTGKPHSFSSAEAAVHTDSAYRNYLLDLADAGRKTIIARAEYDAAKAAVVDIGVGSIKTDVC